MKPEAPVPVVPFAAWPVQHYEPDVGFYWFIEIVTSPTTVVAQAGMQPPARGKPLV